MKNLFERKLSFVLFLLAGCISFSIAWPDALAQDCTISYAYDGGLEGEYPQPPGLFQVLEEHTFD